MASSLTGSLVNIIVVQNVKDFSSRITRTRKADWHSCEILSRQSEFIYTLYLAPSLLQLAHFNIVFSLQSKRNHLPTQTRLIDIEGNDHEQYLRWSNNKRERHPTQSPQYEHRAAKLIQATIRGKAEKAFKI